MSCPFYYRGYAAILSDSRALFQGLALQVGAHSNLPFKSQPTRALERPLLLAKFGHN
jgi:hypothetical protein